MSYKRFTEKRKGKNVIPLLNIVCGVDLPKWMIAEESYVRQYLSGDAVDRFAELEDKIENGTLIELPCKVGDTIYTIQNAPIMHIEVVESIQMYSNKIKFITKDRFNGGFWYYYLEDFGEIAFTNKAEAEAKLKELKQV